MLIRKSKLLVYLVLLSLSFLVSCISRPLYYNEKTDEILLREQSRIMVLPFRDYNFNEGNNSGNLARSIFESSLKKMRFRVVPFEKSSFFFPEDREEAFSVTSDWVVENSKNLGVDFVLFGQVYDYSREKGTTSFLYIFSWSDTDCTVGISAKLISCSTGDVLWSGSFSSKSYTFHDAAWESIDSLVKTIKFRTVKRKKK